MLREGKNIDAVFKEGLAHHEVAPEGYVWDSLEKSLANQQKQRKAIFVWRSLAAACIAGFIALGIGWLFKASEPFATPEMKVVENSMAEDDALLEAAGIEEQVDSHKPLAMENASQSFSPAGVNQSRPSKASTYGHQKSDVNEVSVDDYLSSKSTLQLADNYTVDRRLRVKQEKVYYPIYTYDVPSKPAKKKASVVVGGMLSPSYNSKVSYGSPARNVLKSGSSVNERGINSLGGGLQVRVNTSSRWSFETGVLYSQVGQSVKSAPAASLAGVRQGLVRSSATQANSLGNVVVDKPMTDQSRTQAYANDVESAVLNYDDSYNSLKQTLDYIEVPLMARYALFSKFPYLSVSGGFSSNFLVNNSAYAISGDSKQKIGETSDIKPFVLSSSVGVGVDVPITKTIRLSLEPRFKYFLNSVSSNELNSFQPYSFGVYGGLTFVVK